MCHPIGHYPRGNAVTRQLTPDDNGFGLGRNRNLRPTGGFAKSGT